MVHLVVEPHDLGRRDVRALEVERERDVVGEAVVGLEVERARDALARVDGDRSSEQEPALVPVRAGHGRRRGEDDALDGAVEGRVEPAAHAVHDRGLGDQKVERDHKVAELRDGARGEVELVGRRRLAERRLGREVAHDGLAEVLLERVLVQGREVDAVEIARQPERRLGLLLLPEGAVRDGLHEDRARRRQHEPAGPQEPVPRGDERLEHPLVHEQET